MKLSKVKFGRNEVKYFMHVIPQDGIQIGDDRIQALADILQATNVPELRWVLLQQEHEISFANMFPGSMYSSNVLSPTRVKTLLNTLLDGRAHTHVSHYQAPPCCDSGITLYGHEPRLHRSR